MPTPTFLEDDPTAEQLLRAAARNHEQMWLHDARLRGGALCRENGATWILLPGAPGEVVIPFPRMPLSHAGEQLDIILAHCRRQPLRQVACWSLGGRQPRELGPLLLARGFEWGWQPHWMWLDLHQMRDDYPTPNDLHIGPAKEAPTETVENLPYYSPEDEARWEAERRARPRRAWRFAAWRDGKVVGRSSVFLTTGRLGVAGIYGCGVVPAARNQGIGTAVTAAACRFALGLGCRHALLNATGMGESVYRRLGFTSLGYGQTWWMHRHMLEAPPPGKTLVQFTEAIGKGDLAALMALKEALEPPLLDAPLLCGLTPLQVAVQMEQPASAEWLVQHGATLDVVSAWDLGWKERVSQLLATSPGLANRRTGSWQITPLHVAAERGDTELARAVLAADPDLEIQDTQFHSTPLGWAKHLQRSEIVQLIEQHQAQR